MRSRTFTIVFTALFLVAVIGGSMMLVLSGYQTYSYYNDPYKYVPTRPASSIAGMGMTLFVNHTIIFVLDSVRTDTFYNTNKPVINGYPDWANWTDVQCSSLISASKTGYTVITSGCNSSQSEVVGNEYVGLFKADSLWNDTIRHSGTTAVVGSDWWYELFSPYLNYTFVFAPSVQGKPTIAVNVTNGEAPVNTSFPDYRDSLVSQCAQSIVQKYKPTFMVVHFSETDEAAHANGSLSQSYVDAFKNEDTYIGQILNTYQTAGILGQTLVIVMADHGHVDGGGHGGIEPEVLHIPLILRGPGVIPGEYGTYQHQNTVAPTVAALMGWEVPSDASGTILFPCLNLNSTQQAIYRINLASIRLAQSTITLQKMGYLMACQAQINTASRYLDNAKGNYTTLDYTTAISNAIASESLSRAEIRSSWASKTAEEITGRLLLAIAIIVIVGLILAFLIHKWRGKVEGALTKERDYIGVTVTSVFLYFLLLALATTLTGVRLSASYMPDAVLSVIIAWLIPSLMALVPAGIVFILFLWYLGRGSTAMDDAGVRYGALFLILTMTVFLSMMTAPIVVSSSGVPWYALDVASALTYFYLVVSAVAFALFGLVSYVVGIVVTKLLGFGKGAKK